MDIKINSYDDSRLIIRDEHFFNESSLTQYIEWDALSRLYFLNCRFEKVHLLGKVFGSCIFDNCTFTNFDTRKAHFSSCHFDHCEIMNSDMTRAEFFNCSFKNCNFLEVDLAVSDFDNCEFNNTAFFNSNFSLMLVEDIKVFESNKWVEIKNFSSFKKYFDL